VIRWNPNRFTQSMNRSSGALRAISAVPPATAQKGPPFRVRVDPRAIIALRGVFLS
jgi:hypothetical protein